MIKKRGVKKPQAEETHNIALKVPTGIPGFDEISYGGLPMGRTTLISGSSGSGKTIFASQFLVEGIRKFNQPGVFVTFEESTEDLIKNVETFGWDVKKYIQENKLRYINASLIEEDSPKVMGNYDLKGLIVRIESTIKEIGAKRIVLDSIGSLFHYFNDPAIIRREIYKLLKVLKERKTAVIFTSERLEEYGLVSRYGVEEYIADNVLILRNVLDDEKRRRTIEILKYRGSVHSKGEQSFVIDPPEGITIIPLTRLELKQKSSNKRVSSGNKSLDKMCDGGFYRDSIVLVSGATGTGKTLLVSEFVNGGYSEGEKVLFLAYEESREQLVRNATGWGIDFAKMEKDDKLLIEPIYPETASLEEHLLNIQKLILTFKPNRMALDSLSAIERGSSKKNFREFLVALTSFLKKHEVCALFTSTSTTIVGGNSVTDSNISTITDSIILLRYAEIFGNIHRVITVLKMRGSAHTKDIHEFKISNKGMKIDGKMFTSMSGILGGTAVPAVES